jgi:hypothetical protein
MPWQERNAFSKTLVLFNRHALLFAPLFCGTFCVMAGWIGTDYGVQYLFRDSRPPESIDLSERLLYFVRSTRLFSQLYATALMGLVWTLFVLIEEWDEDPDVLHPVTGVWSILSPPVVLLSLPMIVAALVNRDEHDAPYVLVLLLSLLGFSRDCSS